jgi:hypothetical protein
MAQSTIQETRILPTHGDRLTVEICVGDHIDPTQASFYVRGRCTFQPLKDDQHPFPYLFAVQRQALHELREVLGAEIERISPQGGR